MKLFMYVKVEEGSYNESVKLELEDASTFNIVVSREEDKLVVVQAKGKDLG